jgi:hypothetical protein
MAEFRPGSPISGTETLLRLTFRLSFCFVCNFGRPY